MNVRSVYTNIPNNEGLKVVKKTLKRKNLQTKVIISFLKLILTLNNFALNCRKFSQIKRCEQNAPQHSQTSLSVYLKKYTFIR